MDRRDNRIRVLSGDLSVLCIAGRIQRVRRARGIFAFLSLMALVFLVFVEIRSFGKQDVISVRRTRLGSALPAGPMPHRGLAAGNEINVRNFAPAYAHSRFDHYWSNHTFELHVSRGRVRVETIVDALEPDPQSDKRPVTLDRPAYEAVQWQIIPATPLPAAGGKMSMLHSRGFIQRTVDRSATRSLPLWPFLVATALPPAIWICIRLPRHRPGVCPTCSYDLTGNLSGVCPECGCRIESKRVTRRVPSGQES